MGRSLPVANALRRPNRQVRPAPHGLKGRSATKKSADRGRRPRFCGRLPSYGTFSTDWGAPLGAPFYICGKERKKSLDGRGVMCYNKSRRKMRGCSSMVEPQPSKLVVWVRFPSPAPTVWESSGGSHAVPPAGSADSCLPDRGRQKIRFAGQKMPPKMRQ